MGLGAEADAAGAARAAGVMPARWSAVRPSATDGIWIVEPSTTGEVSLRPLAAATVRVVKLLAAAIDHSVSPGPTTCGTDARPEDVDSRRKVNVSRLRRRMPSTSPRRAPPS